MNLIDAIKELIYSLKEKEKYKSREMKRIFQWKRYLEWKGLTPQEKLSAKRILFVPIFAYLLRSFLNQNLLTVIILISGYLLYRKFDKGKLSK